MAAKKAFRVPSRVWVSFTLDDGGTWYASGVTTNSVEGLNWERMSLQDPREFRVRTYSLEEPREQQKKPKAKRRKAN